MEDKKVKEVRRDEVGYCGRYCRTCNSDKDAMRKAAAQLLDLVKNHIGVARTIELKGGSCEETIKGLEIITNYVCIFKCKGGGGWSSCPVRKCCIAKGFNFCFECRDFPCGTNLWGKTKSFGEKWMNQLREMKEIGVEEWIKKQWKKQ